MIFTIHSPHPILGVFRTKNDVITLLNARLQPSLYLSLSLSHYGHKNVITNLTMGVALLFDDVRTQLTVRKNSPRILLVIVCCWANLKNLIGTLL